MVDGNQVKGMALHKGIALRPQKERDDAVHRFRLLDALLSQTHMNADELRMAVKEVLCDSGKDRQQYEEALVAITVEESLKRYCQRIQQPDFWGGESELLVLSRLCGQPIIVYIPEHEEWNGPSHLASITSDAKPPFQVSLMKDRKSAIHRKGGWGSGFIPIAEYGAEFRKGSGKAKPRKVVRLLYSGRNHYDLLV
ncbi:hypothetical protein SCA6_001352 [Theobroma cacao]